MKKIQVLTFHAAKGYETATNILNVARAFRITIDTAATKGLLMDWSALVINDVVSRDCFIYRVGFVHVVDATQFVYNLGYNKIKAGSFEINEIEL